MKYFLLFALLFSTPALAGVTNRDASVLATDTSREGIRLCNAMLQAEALHRAQWFRDNTNSTEAAMLAMIICDAYTRGRNDGMLDSFKKMEK